MATEVFEAKFEEWLQNLEQWTYERYRFARRQKWENKFRELEAYQDEHGDCNVPNRFEPNPSLANWVKTQRTHYRLFRKDRTSRMTKERIDKLEVIGFKWDPHRFVWDRRLDELREYRGEHGNCNVPQGYEPNPSLGRWVMTQRQQYRLFQKDSPSEMNEERIGRLNSVDFEWDPNRDIWESRLDELREYRGEHGNCNVPRNYEPNPSLANWVNTQRQQYRLFQEGMPSSMTKERINKLEGIDFEWDGRCYG